MRWPVSATSNRPTRNPCNAAAGTAYNRWLQIEGNSGAGKSSLVNAGMLPMIEQGALWARTGFERWRVLGPMMPGKDPMARLAEALEQELIEDAARRDSLGRLKRLEQDERALAFSLRDFKQDEQPHSCSSSTSSRNSSPSPTRQLESSSMRCWQMPCRTRNAPCS